MTFFNECKQEILYFTEEIKSLHSKTFSLMQRIQDLNSWSLSGFEIKTQVENINKKLKQLILLVKYKAEELEMLSEQCIFTEQQAHEIRELWCVMLAKLQSTSSLVNEAIGSLRNQNVLVDIVSFIEELWATIEMVIKVAAKVVIQGFTVMFIEGKDYPILPYSDDIYR